MDSGYVNWLGTRSGFFPFRASHLVVVNILCLLFAICSYLLSASVFSKYSQSLGESWCPDLRKSAIGNQYPTS